MLDDVLVIFDAERAQAAAAVFRDFAAAGHQLLIFTCHEHILKLFNSLRAPVSRLPGNAEPGRAVLEDRRNDETPNRQRESRPSRRKRRGSYAAGHRVGVLGWEAAAVQADAKPSKARKRLLSSGRFEADSSTPKT